MRVIIKTNEGRPLEYHYNTPKISLLCLMKGEGVCIAMLPISQNVPLVSIPFDRQVPL
jgi:hypothetical protein